MKNYILFILFGASVLTASAQAYAPLFIFEQFINAKIHFKNRSVTVASMNYDAANDKMYFTQNGDLMELSNQETIDSISWVGKRCFITRGKGFMEKINLDNGTCYIAWRLKNVNVGSAGAYGTRTQAKVESISMRTMGVFSAEDAKSHSADVFQQKNANEYYIPVGGKLKKITTLKHLQKLYPAHKDAIKKYADKQHTKMEEPLSVLDLLNFCLGLE